ncbi:MAG: DUF4935 domain-containing protein [Fimbriimonadaceae bacterium]|nr:MAG: DUF4935 domain-containing protein [Fimbriimonadaceae bacterium]
MTSMHDLFRHHYRLNESEKQSLWENCEFALDANVLLNVYRYDDETREAFFEILAALKDRIWIPHQSAKEFFENRISVIQEPVKQFEELSVTLDKLTEKINIAKYSKSTHLNVENIVDIIERAVADAKSSISSHKDRHRDLIRDDSYLTKLTSLISERIGQPYDENELNKILKIAQQRINNSTPPGYKDAGKGEPECYGDTIVWFQLISRAKETKRPIILITDDKKEDWWEIIKGERLGPRPELRAEMFAEAQVDFGTINSANFFEHSGKGLSINVKKASVENAKDVSAGIDSSLLSHWYTNFDVEPPDKSAIWIKSFEYAIINSLAKKGLFLQTSKYSFCDYEAIQNDASIFFSFKRIQEIRTMYNHIQMFAKHIYGLDQSKAEFRLYFVFDNEESGLQAIDSVYALANFKGSFFRVHIGFLTEFSGYQEIGFLYLGSP